MSSIRTARSLATSLALAATTAAAVDDAEPPVTSGRPLRLLLVEDHADTRLTLIRLLKRDGETYVRPAPSSRQFVLLTLLARTIMQTLQRFYMAISLLRMNYDYRRGWTFF